MVVALGLRPQLLMGINPAWLPLPGLAGLLFPTAAKLLALSPLVPQWFAQRASQPGTIDKMLEGTGSALDERGQTLYSELVASPAHAQGALKMMAAWDLSSGADSLRQLRCPVRILVGENDRTVRPEQAHQAMRLIPQATLLRWPGLGHLLHEEQPQRFVEDVMTSLRGV
jgi:magnesium chelatase accessory protein